MGLFPLREEWVFSASKRDTQAVTKPMGDTKVELGDGVTVSHGSELMVRQEGALAGVPDELEGGRQRRSWMRLRWALDARSRESERAWGGVSAQRVYHPNGHTPRNAYSCLG